MRRARQVRSAEPCRVNLCFLVITSEERTVCRERHQPYALTMTVSGFAAHTILAREHGLHVLELQEGHTTTRVNARVRVATDIEALVNPNGDPIVVRRYRDTPSPLVRDSVRNWRTGRVDVVLKGAFDVMR